MGHEAWTRGPWTARVPIIAGVRRLIVWLGGAIFVASLAAFAVLYGLVLAQPAPRGDGAAPRDALVDLFLFTVFAAHHSIMARTGAKAWVTRLVSAALERSVYVWIASLLLLAVCWWWRPLPGVAWQVTGPAAWACRAVQACGAWLVLGGAGVIDPLELAGIRQATGTARPTNLQMRGPFGVVRHPIYLGWMLLLFGTPLMTMSRLLMAVVSSAYLLMAIPWEERSLVGALGERYRAYQQRVRWRILPGVW